MGCSGSPFSFMGWTSLNKQRGLTTGEWFRKEYQLGENYELLDIAIVHRQEVYMAIKDLRTANVVALIFLVRYGRGYYNFSYKDMDEFCGPVVYNCPERILNMLTPLTGELDRHGYAREWRRKCKERIERLKTLPKITNGTVIDIGREVKFTNGSSQRYFIRDGRRWRSAHKREDQYLPGQNYYNINHRKYDYSIIS